MTDTTKQAIKTVLGYQLRTGYDVQTGAETNAPSVIWADADYEVGDGACGLHETQKPANEPAIPYVRFDTLRALLAERDEARAETAAMLEKAMKVCADQITGEFEHHEEDLVASDISEEIRDLIDTDHSAALADVVQAAVEKERERLLSSHTVEELSKIAHDAYEISAQENGLQTQEESRVPWGDVPTRNKATTRAAISAVLLAIRKGENHE